MVVHTARRHSSGTLVNALLINVDEPPERNRGRKAARHRASGSIAHVGLMIVATNEPPHQGALP